jgi:hypothetical protein
MAQRMYGSLDVTKIVELINAKHPAFSKSEKNGHVYMSLVVWVRDQPDEYGQDASVQPSVPKTATELEREANKKIYLGNLRWAKPEAPSDADTNAAAAALNSLGGTVATSAPAPVAQSNGNMNQPAPTAVKIDDGLPF